MTGNTESSLGRGHFPGTERIVMAPVASLSPIVDAHHGSARLDIDRDLDGLGRCQVPLVATGCGRGRDGGATTRTEILAGAPLIADAPTDDGAAPTGAGGGPGAIDRRTRRRRPAMASHTRPSAATVEEVPMVPGTI